MRTEQQQVKTESHEGAAPRPRWRAQAGAYLLVAFLAAGLFGALQPRTGIPEEVVQLTQFGPAAGVLMAALLWPGRTRDLLRGALPSRASGRSPGRSPGRAPDRLPDRLPDRQTGRRPGGRRRRGTSGTTCLLVLLTAPLIIAAGAGGYALLRGGVAFTAPADLADPFVLIAVAQLVGACGEEIGWRCLLQPLLRTRFGPLPASVLVGLVWGGWHVQAFAHGPAYAGGFLTATVSMSVVLGLALERVRSNRLLIAGGFHTLVNLGMLLFMADGSTLAMLLFGAACLLTAVPWALWAPTVSYDGGSGRARGALT